MSIFTYKQRNTINLVIIIALGCIIAYSIQGIFGSILSTLVLYTIMRPAFIYMVDIKKLNRSFSALLLLFISVILIILPFFIGGTLTHLVYCWLPVAVLTVLRWRTSIVARDLALAVAARIGMKPHRPDRHREKPLTRPQGHIALAQVHGAEEAP